MSEDGVSQQTRSLFWTLSLARLQLFKTRPFGQWTCFSDQVSLLKWPRVLWKYHTITDYYRVCLQTNIALFPVINKWNPLTYICWQDCAKQKVTFDFDSRPRFHPFHYALMQIYSANANNAQSLNSDLSHLKSIGLIATVFDSLKPNIRLVFSSVNCPQQHSVVSSQASTCPQQHGVVS
jgi:hypothetical protein